MTGVPLGSTWADLDQPGRTFRVDLITMRAGRVVAICAILTNAVGTVSDLRGGRVTIGVDEFTPANYERIKDAA